jgi:alkylation response protein AidB-like acyl-CoA dehydrogenase
MTEHSTNDLYDLDADLNPGEMALRNRTRAWVNDRFMPHVKESWALGIFPTELVREVGDLGAFGCSIKGHGCPDIGARSYGIIMRELERGDSGLRTLASVQGALAMNSIDFYGTEEQKQAWLPTMATGEHLGCFGLTEPGFGSNPGGMETIARRSGDEWVLNGEKMWIGNADVAHCAIIWATIEAPGNPKAIRGFLVPTDVKGYESALIDGKYSLRIARTCRIRLTDVRLPADALLPGSSIGLRAPLSCLDQARYGIAWGVLGAAEGCMDEVLRYAMDRQVFGRRLDSFQMVQGKLADMLTQLTKAQLMSFRLAELKDKGRLNEEQVSMAKYANVEMAQDIARTCREILGGVGILDEYVVMRHLLNLESVATYEGTKDIHRLVLGRWLTGVQAFR